MIDNKTHSILFELQKNLQDLESAKIQMEEFRSSSISVVKGISDIKSEYLEYLKKIKVDYDQRLNLVKNQVNLLLEQVKSSNNEAIGDIKRKVKKSIDEIFEDINILTSKIDATIVQIEKGHSDFLTVSKEENTKVINALVESSNNTIKLGLDQFEIVSKNIENSNNLKIRNIVSLLEQYKNVVEASNSLIETLRAIDFPTKLDALSSKSQLIIESVTSAKQALEIKLNETQKSIIEKSTNYKDQIIHNNDTNIHTLTEKIIESSISLNSSLNNAFNELSKKNEVAFSNLNTEVDRKLLQVTDRLEKQEKQISSLKTLLIVTIGLIIIVAALNTGLAGKIFHEIF